MTNRHGERRLASLWELYFLHEVMVKMLEEYKTSLKMKEVEELLDLILFRPVAFLMVKMISGLPLRPNHVTALSLFAGIGAAYFFSMGTTRALGIAALLYAVANVLDCADGMLARLHNSGTPLGRLVDGVADWVMTILVFIGLGFGLSSFAGDPSVWYLVVAGGISTAIHALLFDRYQQEYVSTVRGEVNFLQREMEKVESQLTLLELGRSRFWRRLVLGAYRRYIGLQIRSQFHGASWNQSGPEVFRSANRRIIHLWSYLGPTTNRSLLIAASLLGNPLVFLWVVLVPGNLLMMVLLIWQGRIQRALNESDVVEYIPGSTMVAEPAYRPTDASS